MLTDERALELWSGPGNRPVIGKYKVIAFARAIEAEVRAEAQEPITSELISSALAAITFYGSQKWAEGKGLISNPALLDVRQSWDAVYAAIQKLAAPQPPEPCPKCAQHEIDFALEHDDKLELQAKVAELEKVAKAYEDQVAAHNKTLDEVARLSALIEKCEKDAERYQFFRSSAAAAMYLNSTGEKLDFAIDAAIAAQKGGA